MFLEDCIKSLLDQSLQDFEIVIADNDSSDGSVKYLRENFDSDKIRIVESETNTGFAGGNNIGFEHCNGEFVVLLNNDTKVEKDWLKFLLDCIESDENIGIAQSLVITEGIPLKYYLKNGTINLLGHNVMEVFEIDGNGYGEVFQANGCSLIIRKKLADVLGGLFLNEYFAYSEDSFLCFKVKFRELKIVHTSRSVVHHKGGGTSDKKKPSFLYFYQERNRLLNFILFFPGAFIIKYIPFLIFNFFMKLTLSFISKKYSAIQLVKAYWWILTNFKWIRNERLILNKLKTADQNSVLNFISCKIFNGENFAERFINSVSLIYCKLVNLKTLENKN